jgi:hypothetical protein
MPRRLSWKKNKDQQEKEWELLSRVWIRYTSILPDANVPFLYRDLHSAPHFTIALKVGWLRLCGRLQALARVVLASPPVSVW